MGDDLGQIERRIKDAADFKPGTPLLSAKEVLIDAGELQKQLPPQQKNPLEERIAVAEDVKPVNE